MADELDDLRAKIAASGGPPGHAMHLWPDEVSAVLARRFGVARLPAVVAFRDGAWLGAFSGILDWAPFVTELARLLDAPPGRPPIFVASAEARP